MDVAQLQVDQQAMREHLRQCFVVENLTPFPPAKKSVQMSQLKEDYYVNVTYTENRTSDKMADIIEVDLSKKRSSFLTKYF